jgi:D5-like protein
VNLAKTDPRIATSASAFDVQPHLLNCENGTIDLRTGELLPHRCEDLITKLCPVKFDPDANSEAWQSFLHDCTHADAELESFLQRAVGYPCSRFLLIVLPPRVALPWHPSRIRSVRIVGRPSHELFSNIGALLDSITH